jgi:hypothetical protein
MMNSLTSNRLVVLEGDHRFLGMLWFCTTGLFIRVSKVIQNLSHILSENELKEPKTSSVHPKISAFGKGNVLLA